MNFDFNILFSLTSFLSIYRLLMKLGVAIDDYIEDIHFNNQLTYCRIIGSYLNKRMRKDLFHYLFSSFLSVVTVRV